MEHIICEAISLEEHIYFVSKRHVSMGDAGLYYNIHSQPIYVNIVTEMMVPLDLGRVKVEATNNRTLKSVPQLSDAFGDSHYFQPGKKYFYKINLTADGKLETILSGTVVCTPVEEQVVSQEKY